MNQWILTLNSNQVNTKGFFINHTETMQSSPSSFYENCTIFSRALKLHNDSARNTPKIFRDKLWLSKDVQSIISSKCNNQVFSHEVGWLHGSNNTIKFYDEYGQCLGWTTIIGATMHHNSRPLDSSGAKSYCKIR